MIYDSHIDTPSQLLRLRNVEIDNKHGHVDFPKLQRGGVDGAFFALYTPPQMAPDAATRYALEMLSATYDVAERNPDIAAITFSPKEAAKNRKDGIVSMFIGMENGSPIQENLSLLRTFYRLGVSYVTLTHNGDNSIADAASEGRKWNGLSPFGREVVAEMNKLGIMIDLSHASDKTFWDCIEVSKAPVIASHSCCRALCGHRRNLTDDMLKALGEKDGYVGINFYPAFLSDRFGADSAEAALLDEAEKTDQYWRLCPSDPERTEAWHNMQDRLLNIWRPGIKEVVDHIDHAVKFAGIDHVGLGSDFDGICVGPDGLEDISKIGAVCAEMRRRGYSEKDVEKVSGKNLMDAWQRVINRSELES